MAHITISGSFPKRWQQNSSKIVILKMEMNFAFHFEHVHVAGQVQKENFGEKVTPHLIVFFLSFFGFCFFPLFSLFLWPY